MENDKFGSETDARWTEAKECEVTGAKPANEGPLFRQLVDALGGNFSILSEAQAQISRYCEPGGCTDSELISSLVRLLDSPYAFRVRRETEAVVKLLEAKNEY